MFESRTIAEQIASGRQRNCKMLGKPIPAACSTHNPQCRLQRAFLSQSGLVEEQTDLATRYHTRCGPGALEHAMEGLGLPLQQQLQQQPLSSSSALAPQVGQRQLSPSRLSCNDPSRTISRRLFSETRTTDYSTYDMMHLIHHDPRIVFRHYRRCIAALKRSSSLSLSLSLVY